MSDTMKLIFLITVLIPLVISFIGLLLLKKRLWYSSVSAIFIMLGIYLFKVSSLPTNEPFIEKLIFYNSGDGITGLLFIILPFIFFVVLFSSIAWLIADAIEPNKTGNKRDVM